MKRSPETPSILSSIGSTWILKISILFRKIRCKFVNYLLPYLTSGQGARTTISPSLTRRLDLITRGIRTFSLDNVSSDKTIATVSKNGRYLGPIG